MSPPARRRGLKRGDGKRHLRPLESPPARRRGLKHISLSISIGQPLSPPARRRGLKPVLSAGLFAAPWVASRAEAWIETDIS